MLALDDKRWAQLTHAYGKAIDIPQQLARLKADPASADVAFRDVDLGALDHQNSVSTALFAAIPHLIHAAKGLPPQKRAEVLAFVGSSVADAALPSAPAVPAFLRESYDEAVAEGIRLLSETLLCSFDADTTRWLLAAMAGLKGHTELCQVISSLDCTVICPGCGTHIEPMKSSLNLEYSRRKSDSE